MEAKEVHDRDMLIDLEKGNCLLTRENSNGTCVISIAAQARTILDGSWDDKTHHMACCSSHCRDFVAKNGESVTSEGEMKAGLSDNSVGDKEKKKRSKKPPRPPRPPSTSPLDPADQKLISELSELAVLKRARIERMKALKKLKSPKPAFSIGNLVALIITVIFCIFILWQGVFSRHGESISFHGPSMSSVGTHGGAISIQLYMKNVASSDISSHGSS